MTPLLQSQPVWLMLLRLVLQLAQGADRLPQVQVMESVLVTGLTRELPELYCAGQTYCPVLPCWVHAEWVAVRALRCGGQRQGWVSAGT